MVHLLHAVFEKIVVHDITYGKAEEYQYQKNACNKELRRQNEQTDEKTLAKPTRRRRNFTLVTVSEDKTAEATVSASSEASAEVPAKRRTLTRKPRTPKKAENEQ